MPHLYQRFMALSQDALKHRYPAGAYHGMYAAMHCAYEARDVEGLEAIAEAAQRQREWVNRNMPDDRMSSQAAQRREGGIDLYGVLVREINVHIRLAKAELRPSGLAETSGADPDE